MEVPNNNYSTPITTFPGYSLVQIHPETDVMPLFSQFNELLTPMKIVAWQSVNSFAKEAPEPHFSWDLQKNQDAIIAKYNCRLSQVYIEKVINTGLASVLHPEIVNYCTAEKFIEESCLKRKITEISSENFIEIINKINACFHPDKQQGLYRKCAGWIFNPNIVSNVRTKETFKLVDQFILKNHPTETELWKQTRAKIWNLGFANIRKQSQFSEVEVKLLKNLLGFFPDPTDIKPLMHQFAKDLCKKIESKEEIVSLKAWVHQKLIEIHPFPDENGRTARLFMHLIGMWGGKQPLLIDDAQEYNDVARSLDLAKFTTYLKNLETRQLKLDPFLDDSLRFHFATLCEQTGCDELCNRVKKLKLKDL